MATDVTLSAFRSCALPLAEWNHRAHLTVAYLLLQELSPDAATREMCEGVRRFNAAHGVMQTPTGGYHHTLTVAWMRVLHAMIAVHGPGESAEAFLAAHPHLLSRVMLRLFYSRERIMSDEARHGWVEPDLAPLPVARRVP